MDAELKDLEFLTIATPFDGGPAKLREFLRDEDKQTEWFDTLKRHVIEAIEADTFEPHLYLLVLNADKQEAVGNDGGIFYREVVENMTIDIADFTKRTEPVHRFREFFELLTRRFRIYRACVAARAWMPGYENGIEKQEQIILIAETANVRKFVLLDVAIDEHGKPSVVGEKTMNTFEGEAYERFRHMVYRDPRHPLAGPR